MQRLLSIVVLAIAVAGCSGAVEELSERAAESAGGDAEVDFSDGSVAVSFEDGDLSFEAGSGVEVPDGLTFPFPDGGNVTTAASDGSYVSIAVQYPIDRYDEIVAYYESWIDGTGGDWSESRSTTDMGDVDVRNATWISGASAIIVNDCISIDTGEFDLVCVTLNESE